MPEPIGMTRAGFDAMECGEPDCDHTAHDGAPFYIHPGCHKGSPVEVYYQSGALFIACAECKAPIVAVEVAAGGN